MEEHILVTGGAGFIGAYLVKELIELGKKVIVVDNLKKKGALTYVNPQAVFIEKDITDPFLYQILDKYNISGVYHLAAQTSGEDSYNNPKEDILTNSYGTWLIANYCKNNNISRLIYMTTSAVYGDAGKDDATINEETLIEPTSIYGASKYAGELYIRQLLKNSKTDYTMFRLTNNYGPGENLNYMKKGMVSIFCSFVWQGQPINVRGSLERYRDFLFVEDTIDALVRVYDCEKCYGNLYLLSTGEKVYVKELVNEIIKQSGNNSDYPIHVSGNTPGDTMGFHADISKIKRDLGWEPKHSLAQGLKKYFNWINKIPKDTKDLSNYHPLKLEEN